MSMEQALLSALPDVLFCFGKDGTILYYQDAKDAEPFFPRNISPGAALSDVLPPESVPLVLQGINQCLEDASTHTIEYQVFLDGTLRDYEMRLVASSESDVLAIVRDISERKKAERLKNEFVSIVSHELRTPLTSIRGSLSLIIGSMADSLSPRAKSLVEIAHKNSERLVSLVNDILDIDKIESGKMVFNLQPIELIPLLHHALDINRSYGDYYGVAFVLDGSLCSSSVKIHADAERLMQVITNLLSNAAKFSPRGSHVLVSVVCKDAHIRVSVTDQGPGIPDEFRSRIFQKFAQADSSDTRQKGGSGLGLSISKAIIERHGGEIDFEPGPQGGTTFYFDIPEWREDEITFDSVQRKPRILICEDTPDLATMLSLMLTYSGFDTDIAYNTTQAKQFLATNQYAAMTLDLVMPGQTGIELIRELRAQERTRLLPIVVVSALAQQGREEMEGGVFEVADWLDKPVNHDQLIVSIQRAISHRGCTEKPRILHVEDDTDVYQVVSSILQGVAESYLAKSLQEARALLERETFNLIILDLSLPDGSGLDLLPLLDSSSRQPIPVMIFSAREVGREAAHKVTRALVKSRTSNQELLNAIKLLIGSYPMLQQEQIP